MNIKVSSLGLAALLLATACSDDRTEIVNHGSELTFSTAVSRANNLSTANLQDFTVWAYSNITNTAPFIDGVKAKKKSGAIYAFDYPVYWPADIDALTFWAVSPSPAESTETDALFKLSDIKHNAGKQIAIDFATATDPLKQLDLIVARTEAQHSTLSANTVLLTFRHALSQIVIKAKEGIAGATNDNRKVKIKGVWVVNASGKGTLSTNDSDELLWGSYTTPSTYGMEFTTAKALNNTAATDLLYSDESTAATTAQSNLLLLPQTLVAWEGKTQAANPDNGAYILVLCRVETIHPGAYHADATDNAVKTEGDTHIHQLFPYTGNFDEAEYGYTCVPIDTKWEPGKRYEYTLSFCGANSGAGIYPPEGSLNNLPAGDDNKYIKTRPSGKNAGDLVLDAPIQFEVKMTDWTDAAAAATDPWTGGDVNMQ